LNPTIKRAILRPTTLTMLLALAMIFGAILKLEQANSGVEVSTHRIGPTPVTVFRSTQAATGESLPVVVISHGFAGSQQLMQPFAVTFARNGYLAVTFDYYGHGRNREPLAGDVTQVEGATRFLLEQTADVVEFAFSLPGAGDEVISLGHSMASDIIVRYAKTDERVSATIAVSLFSPAVTAEAPDNLLVIVGGLEGFLRQEALRVLGLVTDEPEEGVSVGNFADGSARRVVFADGVEHVGVLYSPESMRAAIDWANELTNRSGSGYYDSRGPALLALIAGIGLLAWPLSKLLPSVSQNPLGAALSWRQLLVATVLPALGTPILLWWFPADFLGVLVGGYLAVHFLVYGLLTGICLWWIKRPRLTLSNAATAFPRLAIASVLASLYTAGVIALAMDTYVTSFAITAPRLPLVFLMLAGTLTYFLADEWVNRGVQAARGGHFFARVCFIVSLGIAVALSFEELFFLLIIAVVIVIYFFIYGLFSRWIYRATGHPAVGAIANATAFAWALAAVFPMLSG